MDRQLSRRQILGTGLFLGSAALLAACGSPAPRASSSSGKPSGTLRMSWWGADDRHERTQAALAAFEERYPGVTVKAEFTGDFQGYADKLSTQIAGNSAPDVIQMSGQFIAAYATRGALLDLNQYMPPIDVAAWDKAAVAEATYDDGVRGLSVGRDGYACFYDKGELDALGIATPAPDWNWDDFESILSDVVSAGGKYRYGCSDGGGRYEVLTVFLRQNGSDLFIDDKPAFTADQVADLWDYWGGLREKGLIVTPDIQAAWTKALDATPLVQGLAAFEFASSSTLLNLRSLVPSEVGINPLPYSTDGEAGQVVRSPMYFSAYGRSKNPDAAALLIDFLLNDPEAAEILGTTRSIPTSPEARDAIADLLTDDDKASAAYLDVLDEAGAVPISPLPAAFNDFDAALIRTYQEVMFGRTSSKEGAKRLVDEADRLFA
ncbi:MAG TPA: extracellular solute-binding protein [Naasia sp.]